MCPPRRSSRRPTPPPAPKPAPRVKVATPAPQPPAPKPAPVSQPPAPVSQPPAPVAKEPEPKMRTIKTGTSVRGQQRTQSAAPSRRRRTSTRMGRRAGTNSLRIARNPNTGTGNLNY